MCKHKDHLIAANPMLSEDVDVDEAIRCALTLMVSGETVEPPAGSDIALRYVRDRVNVPRDMPIWSARRFRSALEQTAAMAGKGQGPTIPIRHRRDQDPTVFGRTGRS